MSLEPPLALSIVEAARIAGVGRSTLYEVIRLKQLPVKKIGRRTLILRTDLREWIESRPYADEGSLQTGSRANRSRSRSGS
jgi:excisionase family DNA binding protein